MTPSPVPHALEIGGARQRGTGAASPSASAAAPPMYHHHAHHEEEDDDNRDKVALIQKLVSLEGGAAAAGVGKAGSGGLDVNKLAATGVTLGYFALWFALNVYYNIVNKHVSRVGVHVMMGTCMYGLRGPSWVK